MHIHKWLPRRLGQQIFLILLGVVTVPLVVLGSLLIRTSQKTIEETISRDLKQIALHATGEVLKEYEGAYQALDATASILGTLHAEAWRQETAVVELSLKHPFFRHICSLNLSGSPLACSDPDAASIIKPAAQELLDCVRRSRDHCVSKVRISPDHMPVMNIALPLFRYGKIDGMLVGEFNLRGVWEVIDQIEFGPRSSAILVDEYGRIVAHPDKKEVLQNNTFTYPEVIRDLEQGRNSTRTVVDSKGHKHIIGYSPISSLSWGLIITQPFEEAFASVTLMHYHSWILVAFSVVLAGLIGFIIAQWVSRPMHEMIQATRRLSRGDLSVSMPINRRDDFNRLKFAFNHMTEQIKKARQIEHLSIVGKSAASIAHELKNSLVLVKAFVQLIPERRGDKAFVSQAAETINKELDNWNAMLRNIIDFAKEQMPLHRSRISLNTLVEDVAFLANLRAEKQNLRLTVQRFDGVPVMMADEGKIKQVMVNLITNAFEATPPGGEILVRTFCFGKPPDETVGFEVINFGGGILKENINRIFDPFFTTKDTGLGLGLAICRDIVHKHGGQMEVKSDPERGTVFRVLLPATSTDKYAKESA